MADDEDDGGTDVGLVVGVVVAVAIFAIIVITALVCVFQRYALPSSHFESGQRCCNCGMLKCMHMWHVMLKPAARTFVVSGGEVTMSPYLYVRSLLYTTYGSTGTR